MCFVVACWEGADLLALVCGVYCEFVTFPLVSWVRCGAWLYRFLIFAPLLIFAIPNHNAATVADKLVQEVFLRFGFPSQIHTDQGPEFESHLFKEMCKLLGIEKSRTCPYNPKSDGLIERFKRTLITMLFMFVDTNQKDWDDHLSYVMSAYRDTQHCSTGVSPNLLMLNRDLDAPIDVMVGAPPTKHPKNWLKYDPTPAPTPAVLSPESPMQILTRRGRQVRPPMVYSPG